MSQYLDFFKVNKLPENLTPNAMYLLGEKDSKDLILHIADNVGSSTRSVLSRKDVSLIVNNEIINTDFSKIENFKLVFKAYFIELFQNVNIDITQINNFEQEVSQCFDLFIQNANIDITQISNFEQQVKQYFDSFIQNVDIDVNQIINFEQQVKQYFSLFIQHVDIDVTQISNFNQIVQTIIKNTDIDVNNIFNIDQRVQNIINNFEHTSKLEVKDTYQELKQLAEDKKLNKNQFVFVVDATSPEAKVDKGSATFLYQVPDQKNQEKIEQALADLETLLAKNGDLEKEFRNLKADKYEEYVDLLKEKDAIRQYFFKLENGQEVYQPQVTLAENRLFDLDSAMKLIQVFGQSWEKFVKETISPVMDINKPGTASRINKLVTKLLENYSVLRDESAHRLIKVAEHESMDLKFEVKWGDIQEIPEPITKIITGQVLLQAVEW